MKNLFILMVVAMVGCTSVFAQGTQAAKPTPEQVAKERAEAIRKALALDDKTTNLSYDIELKHAVKVVPAANGGFLVDTKQLDAERDANYKKLFTVEQYTQYQEFQKKKK